MADDLKRLAEEFIGRSAAQLKERDTGIFITAAKIVLDDGETTLLQEILCSDLYKNDALGILGGLMNMTLTGLAETIGWDLLPVLSPHLTGSEMNEDVYNNCIKIVNRLAEVGKPKEMMLGLLEQINQFLNASVYRDFLAPLQTVLQRIGISESLFVTQALDSLYAHVRSLKIPKLDGASQDEKRLMVQDLDYLRIERLTSALLEFVAPFVFLIRQNLALDDDAESEVHLADGTRIIIMKFLLELLDYPLVLIELNHLESDPEGGGQQDTEQWNSVCRSCALQIMTYLKEMNCSFSTLLLYADRYYSGNGSTERKTSSRDKGGGGDHQGDESNEEEEEEDSKLPLLGLSCFAYLAIAEEIEAEMLPSIYSPAYLLKVNLAHLATLLSRMEECAIWKGIELFSSLVEKLDSHNLSLSLLQDVPLYQELAQRLVVIMVRCPSTPIRQRAVHVLPRYINRFDWKGRYRLLATLLHSTEHTGVCGLLIGQVKTYVHETLEASSKNECFTGTHLLELFPLIFKLPQGAETDLLEESDKVLAALNFLRYLLLRDPMTTNRTGVWSCIQELETVYLTQLHTGLDLSKAHYEQRLRQLVDDAKQNKGQPSVINVTVASHDLPKMPVQQQMQVLSSAQFTFDVIASVLGRVGELLSASKRTETSGMEC